jgi:type II secretory pathway pseudopilin PulG
MMIAIIGILIAIAIIIWLGILERRRVDAAANQLAADLRLANTSSTNQLTDWRVVLVPEQAGENNFPDYYLVRLAQPYDSDVAGSLPVIDPNTPPTPRFFPANVKVRDHAPDLKDAPANTARWPHLCPRRIGRSSLTWMEPWLLSLDPTAPFA